MDQHSTIFDMTFEVENPPRRRDILPKWLRIYTLCIIGLGVILLIWTVLITPHIATDDILATYAERNAYSNVGYTIGIYLPSIVVILMGLTVWLERRRAIKFNMLAAVYWGFIFLGTILNIGLQGLSAVIYCLIYIPFWIGLFRIRYQWEVEAIRGKGII